MRREDDPYRNVPADILDEVRKKEHDRTSADDGILGGLVSDKRSTPKPERIKPARHNTPRRVSDIRSGHNYT